MVDGVLPGQDQLGDGHEGISFLQQTFDDAGQGLGGVLGGVVKQHDGTGTDFASDPLGDVGGGQVFPVQTVPTGSGWKVLGDKGFRMWRRVVFSVG